MHSTFHLRHLQVDWAKSLRNIVLPESRVFTRKTKFSRERNEKRKEATSNRCSNIQQLIARSAHEAVSWKIARENSEGTRRSRAIGGWCDSNESEKTWPRERRIRESVERQNEMLASHERILLHPSYRSALTHPVSDGPAGHRKAQTPRSRPRSLPKALLRVTGSAVSGKRIGQQIKPW